MRCVTRSCGFLGWGGRLGGMVLAGWLLAGTAGFAREPAGRVFDVRSHGAAGDGQTLDTAAIQKAIDACAAAGGGRVLLPAGNYLSGTLRMRSGVELHLAEAARLIGTKDLEAYGGFEERTRTPRLNQNRWTRGLIVGENLKDIAFTGAGTIDGNQVFDPKGEEKMRGPHTILLGHCQNVTLRELTIRDSANYAFLFYFSEKVRVEKATFEGGWDGVHFRGSPNLWNKDVRIHACRFFTGDDSIAGHYIEDAVVEHCEINSSCNGVRLIGPARRLAIEHCRFFGPGKFPHRTQSRFNMLAGLILQPSSWEPTPGELTDIKLRHLAMRDVQCPFQITLRPGNTGSGLRIEHVKASGVYLAAGSIESWAETPYRDVELRHVEIESVGGGKVADMVVKQPGTGVRPLPAWGLYLRNVDSVILEHLPFRWIQPDTRPALKAVQVEKLRMESVVAPPAPDGSDSFDLQGVKEVERR